MSGPFLSFVDCHAAREAFIGNRLGRLVDLIVDQGEALLRSRGATFRSTAASTMLLISERNGLSTADVARELRQPHQLATQRVEALLELGLVERNSDPRDRRRSVLALSPKGRTEAQLLADVLRDADNAFRELYTEIGTDLSEVVFAAMEELLRCPLEERIAKGPTSSNPRKAKRAKQ